MPYFIILHLLISLLTCTHQSFVSCNDKVLAVRLNVLLTNYNGWREIKNVKGITEISENDTFVFTSTELFQTREPDEPLVIEKNAIAKYFMIATLLGCQYMDVLMKYLNLIEQFLTVCQNERTQNSISEYTYYSKCMDYTIETFDQLKDSLPMFFQMHSALSYIIQLCPEYESNAKIFSDTVSTFIALLKFSIHEKPLQYFSKKDNICIGEIIRGQDLLSDFVNNNKQLLKAIIEKNCILLNDIDSMELQYGFSDINKYVATQMDSLRNEVIQNYYDKLGFKYITAIKTTFVPLIVTQWPFSLYNPRQLLIARLDSLLYNFNGWQEIDNVRGMFMVKYNNYFVFSSQDLLKTLYPHESAVNDKNVEAKLFMIVTLLFCKYVEVLFKFLNILRHNLHYCQTNFISDGQELAHCYNCALKRAQDSLSMFELMYCALDYFHELCPDYEQLCKIKEFRDQLFEIRYYLLSNINIDIEQSLTNIIFENLDSLAAFIKDNIQVLMGLVFQRCEFPDTSMQTYNIFLEAYKQEISNHYISVSDFVKARIDSLAHEITQKYFQNLGFMYDDILKKAIVPTIWTWDSI